MVVISRDVDDSNIFREFHKFFYQFPVGFFPKGSSHHTGHVDDITNKKQVFKFVFVEQFKKCLGVVVLDANMNVRDYQGPYLLFHKESR